MKKLKRFLLLSLVLGVIAACFVFHASAAMVIGSGYCGAEGDGKNLSWSMDLDGVITISGSGKMRDYSAYAGPAWYPNRKSIKKIIIESGVTSIGDYAFYGCEFLTNVSIAKTVRVIGDSAFYDSYKLQKITIPTSVIAIGEFAFAFSGLTEVSVPSSAKTLEQGIFDSCYSLVKATLPGNMTAIPDRMFYHCPELAQVNFPSNITGIGEWAFYWCSSLPDVTIPNKVTTIGCGAFYDCDSIKKVTIGRSVETIGYNAFNGCARLVDVYFEGNGPSVGNNVFGGGSTLYYIPGKTGWTDSHYYNAYYGTWNGYNLDIWEDKVLIVSGYCGGEGDGTNLVWKLLEGGILTIRGSGNMEDYDYYSKTVPWNDFKDQIENVIIGNQVTSIGDYAFAAFPNLTSAVIGSGVLVLGDGAFTECAGLTGIRIPNGVTTIGAIAFDACSSLAEISIPGSVETIGNFAFGVCGSLQNINVNEQNVFYCDADGVLMTKNMEEVIQYPSGKEQTDYELPNGVKKLASNAFEGCGRLESVTFPDSVTDVGDCVFAGCTGLSALYFKGDAPAVGADAFAACPVTLYYIPGMTGWTDGDAYDEEAGTWNGYKLEIWQAFRETDLSVKENAVSVNIRAGGACKAVFAIYEADGKFVKCQITDLAAGVTEWKPDVTEVDLTTRKLQVFLVENESSGTPWASLCPVAAYSAK